MTDRSDASSLSGWDLAHAACQAMRSLNGTRLGEFRLNSAGYLSQPPADDQECLLSWCSSTGWQSNLPQEDDRRTLLDLYLPITGVRPQQAITLGHLGQSLDGFIATPSGDSSYVTGSENILHLHRLRALCDAVVVGALTVEADNPRLTTRLVQGRNPLRVVIADDEAATLRVCARGAEGVRQARARGEDVLEVAAERGRIDLDELLEQLHARGCWRVFVEGGGVTVSSFLEAGLLDRLHVAVAPLLIGNGRPAIRLAARQRLKDCMAVEPHIYRTGRDILYDCDLRASTPGACRPGVGEAGPVRRIA
jgi:diaminohydroxyphosphoribosylaminopyrimidine deaminase / 5-amino-6-(5-phosphoribosylamino)uracil reductase